MKPVLAYGINTKTGVTVQAAIRLAEMAEYRSTITGDDYGVRTKASLSSSVIVVRSRQPAAGERST